MTAGSFAPPVERTGAPSRPPALGWWTAATVVLLPALIPPLSLLWQVLTRGIGATIPSGRLVELFAATVALMLAATVRAQAPAPPRAEGEGPFDRLILRGVTVIDGTGAPAISNATVLLNGQRIEEVGPTGAVALPPNTEVIDITGMTILPGLIDCHDHLASQG